MSAYDSFIKNKVFSGLDGLRFFSIMAVVWHHSVRDSFSGLAITKYGFLGVDLFFVISGFLIVTLLLRESTATGGISLSKFYTRRTLRIFPLYYGYILFFTLFYVFLNKNSEYGKAFVSEFWIYLFYLGNFFPVKFGIVWSLASEEQFYLLWPFLEKYCKKYIVAILIFAIIINEFINFAREPLFDWLGLAELTSRSIIQITFTPILLGVSLAHLLHNRQTFQRAQPLFASKYAALLWLSVLVAGCFLLPEDISGLPRLMIHITMVLLLGAVVVNEQNYLLPFLRIPFIARIGAISYGIYLFHLNAIISAKLILSRLGINHDLLVFFCGLIISIVAAELSYRFFETPFLKLKAKFSIIHQKHI